MWEDCLPESSTDLVTALAGLEVDLLMRRNQGQQVHLTHEMDSVDVNAIRKSLRKEKGIEAR